jgi:hypothetical protein
VLGLRLDHDSQRDLLQVPQLRQHVGLQLGIAMAEHEPSSNGKAASPTAEAPARAAEESGPHSATARIPVAPARPRKKRRRSRATRKGTGRAGAGDRKTRSFPASTFEEALTLPLAIQRFAAGQPVRRVTLFDHLQKSPDSGHSRQLITNSSRYGLTKGSYAAERLELTDDGRVATSPDVPAQDQLRAKFKLAIEKHEPFKLLYDRFKGNKLPSQEVLRDYVVDQGLAPELAHECVDTFVLNAKFLGLLKTMAGAERLLTLDHVLDELPRTSQGIVPPLPIPISTQAPIGTPATTETRDWSRICFYISPIGEEDTEERRHADLFLGSIVEPAVKQLGLTVVRADHIAKPGMITRQVIEHVVRARLVIADLSFNNASVSYELCLRHAVRMPTVHLIRSRDRIPFDLDQFRTVRIDTTDIYSLVPSLETYKSEITNHARRVLEDAEAADNPLTVFFPGIEVKVPVDSRA